MHTVLHSPLPKQIQLLVLVFFAATHPCRATATTRLTAFQQDGWSIELAKYANLDVLYQEDACET